MSPGSPSKLYTPSLLGIEAQQRHGFAARRVSFSVPRSLCPAKDSNPRLRADGLPVQLHHRLNDQLPAADQRFPPSPCPESPPSTRACEPDLDHSGAAEGVGDETVAIRGCRREDLPIPRQGGPCGCHQQGKHCPPQGTDRSAAVRTGCTAHPHGGVSLTVQQRVTR
jgi:hypothetical protein